MKALIDGNWEEVEPLSLEKMVDMRQLIISGRASELTKRDLAIAIATLREGRTAAAAGAAKKKEAPSVSLSELFGLEEGDAA